MWLGPHNLPVLCLQAYLKLLLNTVGSKAKPGKANSQTRVAARCMCGLLSALHHFNYSSDLLQAVVPLMVHQDEQLRAVSCEAIEDVLIHDTEGKVAVAAVQLVRLLNPKSQTLSCDCVLADVIEGMGQAMDNVLIHVTEGKVAVAAVQLVRLLNPKPSCVVACLLMV